MSASDESTAPPEPVVEEVAVAPPDPMNRLLGSAAIALGALALAEIIGTFVMGLSVKVKEMNFASRQGYAFLTQLEKSPIGLVLVVASIAAAIAVIRADRSDDGTGQVAVYASWIVIGTSVLLAIATILAVLARFRVGEIVSNQPVDAIARRALVVFVIRNFGTAVVALLIAVGAAFQRTRALNRV